jgi:hypothetical protein
MPTFSKREVSDFEMDRLVDYLSHLKQPRLKAETINREEDRIPKSLEEKAIREGAAEYVLIRWYLSPSTKKRLDAYNRSRPLTDGEKRAIRADLTAYREKHDHQKETVKTGG